MLKKRNEFASSHLNRSKTRHNSIFYRLIFLSCLLDCSICFYTAFTTNIILLRKTNTFLFVKKATKILILNDLLMPHSSNWYICRYLQPCISCCVPLSHLSSAQKSNTGHLSSQFNNHLIYHTLNIIHYKLQIIKVM